MKKNVFDKATLLIGIGGLVVAIVSMILAYLGIQVTRDIDQQQRADQADIRLFLGSTLIDSRLRSVYFGLPVSPETRAVIATWPVAVRNVGTKNADDVLTQFVYPLKQIAFGTKVSQAMEMIDYAGQTKLERRTAEKGDVGIVTYYMSTLNPGTGASIGEPFLAQDTSIIDEFTGATQDGKPATIKVKVDFTIPMQLSVIHRNAAPASYNLQVGGARVESAEALRLHHEKLLLKTAADLRQAIGLWRYLLGTIFGEPVYDALIFPRKMIPINQQRGWVFADIAKADIAIVRANPYPPCTLLKNC